MPDAPAPVRLRLLATSDIHMHLAGFDYRSDRPRNDIGLARLAQLVRTARAEGPCLLLDNGDLLQGTVLGDLVAASGDDTVPRVLKAMGYDAMGLGNHDMDFGLAAFRRFTRAAPMPVVCSNFALPGTLPFALVPAAGGALTVGIVSVLPPQVMLWNARHLSGLAPPQEPVRAARAAVEGAREAGADIVVVLGHTGLAEDGPEMGENFGRSLARIDGVDALVLGHTHRQLPGPDHAGMPDVDAAAGRVGGVPAVMPGFAGACLGQIDLTLSRASGAWRVTEATSVLRRAVDAAAPDPAVGRAVAALHDRARSHLAQPVGTAQHPLHSYFAALGHDPGQALCALAMRRAIGPVLAAEGLDDLPLLAAAAPNAAGGRGGPGNYVCVPPGPVRRRHLTAIAPYPNEVWALRLSGAAVRAWLERAAGFFSPGIGSETAMSLVNAEHPVFNFDALFGLDVTYDLTRAPGCRVRDVVHGGAPLRDAAAFTVVTTSYRAAGGGGFPGTGLGGVVARAPGTLMGALEAVLAEGPLSKAGPPPFSLQAGGAKVTLDTPPEAAAHLGEISALAPCALGPGARGFIRLGLTL